MRLKMFLAEASLSASAVSRQTDLSSDARDRQIWDLLQYDTVFVIKGNCFCEIMFDRDSQKEHNSITDQTVLEHMPTLKIGSSL
jgi:hypothetical protein